MQDILMDLIFLCFHPLQALLFLFFFFTFNAQNSSSSLLGTPSGWVLDINPTVFGSLLGLWPHTMFWDYLEYFFLQMWKMIPFSKKLVLRHHMCLQGLLNATRLLLYSCGLYNAWSQEIYPCFIRIGKISQEP